MVFTVEVIRQLGKKFLSVPFPRLTKLLRYPRGDRQRSNDKMLSIIHMMGERACYVNIPSVEQR